MKKPRSLVTLTLVLWGCNILEADPESFDPAVEFVDPDIDPATRDIEDDPNYSAAVAEFAGDLPYLQGFADGERIWYWSVPGEVPTFIAPMYRLFDTTGQPIGRPIIDAIPSTPGYSPWWRMFRVQTTASYAGERIWSRAAIDAAVELGLVEIPEPTSMVLDCPVVERDTQVAVGGGEFVEPTTVWYRNRRVRWVQFSAMVDVPVEVDGQPVRQMPRFPIYIFQRIDEPLPLYEAVTGIDLNGDTRLNASNNVFAGLPGGARYSPLWWVADVRTTGRYRSIDNPPVLETDLSAESQFFDPVTEQVRSSSVVSVTPRRDELRNCPIQVEQGAL